VAPTQPMGSGSGTLDHKLSTDLAILFDTGADNFISEN
jgi:hypothetical protein